MARSRRLVIDTDIMRSSGGLEAVHPKSKHCRDFLLHVLKFDHQVVITEAIKEEWQRHKSAWASRWIVQMRSRRLAAHIEVQDDNTLRTRIAQTTTSQNEKEAALKDCHLLEAALAADKTVISTDDKTARKLFSKASISVGELRTIVWVNPDRAHQEALQWLEQIKDRDKAKVERADQPFLLSTVNE